MAQPTAKSTADDLFVRACKHEESGDLKTAFKLMLASAKLGDLASQLNVGNYYDAGSGVRRNRSLALYWYRRAHRRGDSGAAHNIGVVYRNEKQFGRALSWFERAVALGDPESNLEIGRHYLENEGNPRKASVYFRRVLAGELVTESGAEEAAQLLRLATKALKSRNHR